MIDLSVEQTRRVAAPTPARVLDPARPPWHVVVRGGGLDACLCPQEDEAGDDDRDDECDDDGALACFPPTMAATTRRRSLARRLQDNPLAFRGICSGVDPLSAHSERSLFTAPGDIDMFLASIGVALETVKKTVAAPHPLAS